MHKKKYLGLQELGDASPSLGSIIDDLSAAYHLSLDYQNNYIDFIIINFINLSVFPSFT